MKRILMSAIVITILLGTTTLKADPTLNVFASAAPNFFGSPSWGGYVTNALFSLENEAGDIGDRLIDPTAYEIFEEDEVINVTEIVVSGFSSWRGVADEVAPFDMEFGNRLHFGLHVIGDGMTQFRLEDLLFEIASDDPGNSLGFVGDFAGLDYSPLRYGIDWGADRMKGGGDDTIVSAGSGTTFVDELVYVGVGNAHDASGAPGATNQDKIDATASEFNYLIGITGSYTLNDENGSQLGTGSTRIFTIPEPTSGLILSFACLGLVARRRNRQPA